MSGGVEKDDPPDHPTRLERLVPPVDLVGEDGQPRPARMTHQEQLVAVALGVANVAIAAGAASATHNQQALVLAAGLAASAITIVGARVGNRILAITGLFATTLVRPSSAVLFLAVVLPYYAAAMWMFIRYNRLMKAQSIVRRQQRSESRGPSTPSRKKGGSGGASAPAKKRPTASKRYTPPKPPKKRPPPPQKPPRDRSPVD